jgi:hypothetical protein
LDAGVDNIFDKANVYPLGGLDYLKTVGSVMSGGGPVLVNAMGRSANVALTLNF